jgi:hypothetical protein
MYNTSPHSLLLLILAMTMYLISIRDKNVRITVKKDCKMITPLPLAGRTWYLTKDFIIYDPIDNNNICGMKLLRKSVRAPVPPFNIGKI